MYPIRLEHLLQFCPCLRPQWPWLRQLRMSECLLVMVYQKGQTLVTKRKVCGDTADNLYFKVKQPSSATKRTLFWFLSQKVMVQCTWTTDDLHREVLGSKCYTSRKNILYAYACVNRSVYLFMYLFNYIYIYSVLYMLICVRVSHT